MVRYLNPADHHPTRIRKVNKDFAREIDFKVIKFSIKIIDIDKIEKNNCNSISVIGYENKNKYPIYVSKNTFKRPVDLLQLGEEGKRHYVLIKDINTFMYDHTLHHRQKHFCPYCLQAFSTAEILKSHVVALKLMVNK